MLSPEFHPKTGEKCKIEGGDIVAAEITRKFGMARQHIANRVARSHACWHCGQPLLTEEARKTMLGHSGALRVALEDIEIENFTMLIPPRDDEYDQP